MFMVYVIHMTERRITLGAKILNRVRSVGQVIFKRIWMSQAESEMHGRTLSACPVRSRIETRTGFYLNQPGFGS